MKESFLKELREALEAKGVQNIEDILDTYSSRFDLGYEAGMTDEEILDMLGSIEDIVSSYTEKEVSKNKYNITLELVHFSDFEIVKSKNPGVEFEMDRRALEYVKIIREKNSVSLKSKKSRNGRFEGRMYVGEDVEIDNLVINACSVDLKVDSLSGKSFVFSNKSGDACFNNIDAEDKVIISNVSGDMKFNGLTSQNLIVSTVSGDIGIRELVCDRVQMSMVSGDIAIHRSNDAAYTINSVSGDFRIDNEIDEDKIKVTSLSGDCYVNGKPRRKNLSARIQDAFKNMKF